MSDLDFWLKPGVKQDRFEFYEVILCYVDDVMAISNVLMRIIDGIKATFKLKGNNANVLDMYLGRDIQQGKM